MSGIDPVKLRRRNLIKKSQMPYKTAVGTTFDSGDFEPILDKALELADYDDFKKRKREAAKRGKYRGLGISCMLEHAGGAPLESAMLSFPGGEHLLLTLNVQNTGQGHATVFPAVIAERLGIPFETIAHTNGDSSDELPGYASVGSRSAMTVGHSLVKAMETILEKGKPIAAAMLEAGETDIAYKDGAFEVVGTDRRITLFDVAARAAEMKKRGEIAEDLDTRTKTETPLSFPNGCHIAEVEIDPETGHLAIVAYSAVDDCGRPLNHMIVEGQLHGSLMQGLGQALMENTIYDRDHGQLVTGSFMDYAMPRADDAPPLRDAMHNVPATTNPLGVKGVGEAGTTAAHRGGDERGRRRHPERRRNASGNAGLGAAYLGSLPARQGLAPLCRHHIDDKHAEAAEQQNAAAHPCGSESRGKSSRADDRDDGQRQRAVVDEQADKLADDRADRAHDAATLVRRPSSATTASAVTRNSAMKPRMARSSPGQLTPRPSPVQNRPNADSSTPTANFSLFSGTRASGRCTTSPASATSAQAAKAAALTATSAPRPADTAMTMNTTSRPSSSTALKLARPASQSSRASCRRAWSCNSAVSLAKAAASSCSGM